MSFPASSFVESSGIAQWLSLLVMPQSHWKGSPPWAQSHCIVTFVLQPGSVITLNSAPHARSRWLCPHHLPGSSPSRSLPAPVTALVHSVSTGNALLDDFAAFLHFPRDRTAGKGTSRLGTIFKQCFYFLELAGLFWLNVKLKGGKTTTGEGMVILILIPSL